MTFLDASARSGPATCETIEAAGAPRQAVILLALSLFAGLMWRSSNLLNDPDTQWHIATGRMIWTQKTFPTVDVFSHTFADAPWIAKEWLSQLLLFSASALAGWSGVCVLAAAVVAATFALVFDRLLIHLRPSPALIGVLVAAILAAPALVARPHVLVLPVIALWFAGLTAALDRDAPPSWGLPLLMAVWANMHASFPLGLVLAGCLAGEGVLAAPPALRRARLTRWAGVLLLSACAACVSPYGMRTLAVIAALFSTPEAMRYITEWQPLRGNWLGAAAVLAFGLAMVPLLAGGRKLAFRTLAVLALGFLMVAHVRFALLFAIVAPILVAGPAARAFRGLRGAAPAVPGARTAVLALALLGGSLVASTDPSPPIVVRPVAALDAAVAAGLDGPVYNDFDFAGLLIDRGIRTFVDGRTDQLFGGGFSTALNDALGQPQNAAFVALLDRYGVTWALVKSGSPDARHLSTMDGWSALFDDGTAAVFARRGTPTVR